MCIQFCICHILVLLWTRWSKNYGFRFLYIFIKVVESLLGRPQIQPRDQGVAVGPWQLGIYNHTINKMKNYVQNVFFFIFKILIMVLRDN